MGWSRPEALEREVRGRHRDGMKDLHMETEEEGQKVSAKVGPRFSRSLFGTIVVSL
jgi:hypothetical protein